MKLSPNEFADLLDEVVKQSGALLPDHCVSRNEDYDPKKYTKVRVREREARHVTQGCGHQTMLIHNYDPGNGQAQFARACAVCDNVALWPRYKKAVFG